MKAFGAALVFFAEVGMLIGLAWWGWEIADGPLAFRVAVAVAVPLAIAIAWGAFLSPRAPRPLKPRIVATLVRLDLLLLGAAAAWFAGGKALAGVTAALALVGTLLARGEEQQPMAGMPGTKADAGPPPAE